MAARPDDTRLIGTFLHQLEGAPARRLRLKRRPLQGGLQAEAVLQVAAHFRGRLGHARSLTFVMKRLSGTAAREALVYERLVAAHARHLAPRLLSAERLAEEQWVLFLEAVERVDPWPWREARVTQTVLERLAHLHLAVPLEEAAGALPPWDYEAELQQSALSTLEQLEGVRRLPHLAPLARRLPALKRLVQSFPALRRELLAYAPFTTALLHGDVHPGNALLRQGEAGPEPVLLDWGRARLGSPLEDVSSWLQSLGYWEPEARRRHDTLLAGYLSARGLERRLTSDLRAAYWLAGASNALSGALRYHLWVATSEQADEAQRGRAAHSACDWLRVVRRADAVWS